MTTTRLGAPLATRRDAPRAAPAGGGLRSLLVDLAIPLVSYYLLRRAGCGLVTSLALSSVASAAHAVLDLVRSRVVNGLAAVVAGSFFSVPLEKMVVTEAGPTGKGK
jgi:hypothetical protein